MRSTSCGRGILSFDNMSRVTRPVKPKAVVWYRLGRVVMHHRRISDSMLGCKYIHAEIS